MNSEKKYQLQFFCGANNGFSIVDACQKLGLISQVNGVSCECKPV